MSPKQITALTWQMRYDPKQYGAEIADLLCADHSGQRLLPLVHRSGMESPVARQVKDVLQGKSAQEVFPGARVPDAALAGLWLYFSCWDEAHNLADACRSAEGHWVHAIVHRQEPDYWNSSYWYRRVAADHRVVAELEDSVQQIAPKDDLCEGGWDPDRFNHFVEQSISTGDEAAQQVAREIQRAEWQLLFNYCASTGDAAVTNLDRRQSLNRTAR